MSPQLKSSRLSTCDLQTFRRRAAPLSDLRLLDFQTLRRRAAPSFELQPSDLPTARNATIRFFTCTPKEFGGGADFFSRDSGLTSRGLRANGVESMAVMPGSRKPGDLDELIRTDYANLESVEWWRSQNLDGLVLYAWGAPRYRRIAAAVREAGIFLVLNQDNAGVISPLNGLRPWFAELWNSSGKGRGSAAWLRFFKQIFKGLTFGLIHTDPLRASHLRNADLIACVAPTAAEHYRKLCRIYGGAKLAEKITVVPHPVESHFQYDGREKEHRIVCVGRWSDQLQKRTWMLLEVLSPLLEQHKTIQIAIAGAPTPELTTWHEALPASQQERVDLMGFTDRASLAELMASSTLFYSPSAYESFGIAAAEALCCGSSVVAGKSISMSSFDWFASENSGTIANPDTPAAHLQALLQEISLWENKSRDPQAISTTWTQRLHAKNIAKKILNLQSEAAQRKGTVI